ncbi:hypothetical protein TNIN_172171 [Trichonephila inaurata madagascariensis]|uniref:Uncharacterized protein n=1 Tax=Trichonephila inaurata madagascariensis TaxID=2747483 RepID=A0A8X7BUI4_9ARAC|nr:hypothetical protein TNIN_172171 [Trichonephila inaurata madagascariensis]
MIEWDQNEHVVDWDVENFSCYPQTTIKNFSTGQFRSKIFDNTSWKINLYPRGIDNADDISCFLERIEDDNEYPTEIRLNFEFCLLTSDGFQCEKTVKKAEYSFRKKTSFGFKDFVKRDDIFTDKETYLLKDMLKLRCRMRKCIPRIKQNFINVGTKVDAKIPRIQIPIKILGERLSKTVFFVSTKKVEDLLTLTVYEEKDKVSDPRQEKKADSSLQIIITKTKTRAPIYVSCHVKVVDSVDWFLPLEHTAVHAYEGKQETEAWKFPSFIKISKLTKSMIQDNTINLDFNINVCDDEFQTYLEDSAPSKLTLTGNDRTLKKDLVTLYKTGLYSDAKLKIGEECFPVHKSILSIRSSVFKKLFEGHANAESAADGNDPKNDQECVLELNDVDKDNLKRMLDFVYTDVFEFKGFTSCLPLYASAYKYDIPSLKEKCFLFLMGQMAVREAFTTLLLADELNDGKLKLLALDTIKKNREYALLTEEWMQFAEKEPELMSQVLRHIRIDKN